MFVSSNFKSTLGFSYTYDSGDDLQKNLYTTMIRSHFSVKALSNFITELKLFLTRGKTRKL